VEETGSLTKTLFVGNLPWSVTPDELTQIFSRHVEVLAARIASDRETGRSRGFGFVEVPEDQAQTAIDALNGTQVGGREITVSEARPREERGYRR
jgi:RNA recognition motif-containing protein